MMTITSVLLVIYVMQPSLRNMNIHNAAELAENEEPCRGIQHLKMIITVTSGFWPACAPVR